ncbi:MAG: short-chain dehydrogenase/reductase [Proteobacteria bacterium]|nr:short-chain dehydrogenase/reductase [Pseudomonadota bacterium]
MSKTMAHYALITGASRGIGAAFAHRLAAEKRPLILVSRDREDLGTLKTELGERHGIPVHVLVADLTQADAARTIHDTCARNGWRVSLLVNNAGMGRFGEFLQHPLEDYGHMIRLNVQAPVELTHLFLADMRAAGHGEIINVASMAAFQPTPYIAVYGATKAFLLAFSEAVAAECFGTPIRILALCPGATRTNFFAAAGLQNLSVVDTALMQSSEAVVDAALQALKAGRTRIIPGWLNRVMATLSSLVPRRLNLYLSARAIKRGFGLGGE